MAGLVLALGLGVMQFEASKECRGGAFGGGFSGGFDVRRCSVIIRRIGGDAEIRFQLPR
jgi:hypothetical protein